MNEGAWRENWFFEKESLFVNTIIKGVGKGLPVKNYEAASRQKYEGGNLIRFKFHGIKGLRNFNFPNFDKDVNGS